MENSDIAISVNHLSKMFRLFESKSHRLAEALNPFGKVYHREHWALRDINFEVRKGEIVGIMGCNGSGKSTLLQIICGTMQPSGGHVVTSGRISALLELGAGFNPEFTGRENVYLNGAIMGFTRKEMEARMSAIEEFADVGEFFDQPVKTYSSGMFVRVAFASAINIDPEILIVDEALAVGDAKFQHKCYLKLENFRSEGKTIIIVTHDVGQITTYCDRAILLDKGSLIKDDAPRDVADHYIEILFGTEKTEFADGASEFKEFSASDMQYLRIEDRPMYCKDEVRYGNRKKAEILDCYLQIENVVDPVNIFCGQTISLYIVIDFKQPMKPMYGFGIKNMSGVEVYGTNTFMQKIPVPFIDKNQKVRVKFSFSLPLQAGEYFLDVGITEVDASTGGIACDVRRSVGMVILQSSTKTPTFAGLFNLEPKFEFISELEIADIQS